MKVIIIWFAILVCCGTHSIVDARELQLPNSSWQDSDGALVTLGKYREKIRLLSLFYTNCPHTCNLTMNKLQQLEERLISSGQNAEIILITLDPLNDTPASLSRYRHSRDLMQPNWHFLTGDQIKVELLAKTLGYDFIQLDDHVFHKLKIFAFDIDGQITDEITVKSNFDNLNLLAKNKN